MKNKSNILSDFLRLERYSK